MRLLFSFLLVVCSASFCSAQNVAYTESFAEIQNPDRGFYQPINGVASSFTPLTAAQLTNLRTNPFTPWQGNYIVSPTIIFRHYVLDIFKSANLSASFLNGVQADFDAARAAGVRLLLRFSYTITPPTGSCGSWICPPYGDAPKSVVLAHIAQLKPYLQGNSDVILAVQNGFIGVWGEQYYTDYFGDASAQGKLTDQNWQDRIDVLRALLDAVPANRMVQVRYPQMKQKFIYGINAPVTSQAMGSSQANNATNIARIGFHNDCFLSAPDDQGTFWDYGTSATFASDQTTVLKAYWANDSKYVGVGGETCDDAFSPQNDCNGQAVADMDLLNYSYLNADYNNAVNNDWQSGGCMPTIKQRLGYRFVMRDGIFPATGTSGGSLAFTLNVENVGFAAPFNPRTLKLLLRNTSTAQVVGVALTGAAADTRFWLSGQTVTLNQTLALPSAMPPGNYELLLHLSDASNSNAVATRPEYSVQFANTGTWEPATGFNKLNHTIAINSVAANPLAPTNLVATAASAAQVNLTWAAAAGATSYRVERSTTNGGPYTQIANQLTNLNYSDTGLAASTTYYYVVKATNATGTSPASGQANATTAASAGEDITNVAGGTVSAQYQTGSPAGEEYPKLIDDKGNTKYLTFHASAWVQYQAPTGYVVNSYTITSANDAPQRDPLNWTLQGSNNGSSWTLLDSRSNEDFPRRAQTRTFNFTNSTGYAYYRFNLSNNSGPILQLAEIELFGKPAAGDWSTQIEAENYAAMRGVQTEACSEGGLNVGWIDAGDWMTWDVNIPSSGTYTVEYRVASLAGGGTIRLEQAGGTPIVNTVAVSNTGGWQNWTTISQSINLTGGQQQITINAEASGWNIDWLRIKQGTIARSAANSSAISSTIHLIPKAVAEEGIVFLYPNPAASELTISGMEATAEVGIYDLLGKLILPIQKLSSDQPVLNVKSLNPGTYLLKVEGKKSRTFRFIKE